MELERRAVNYAKTIVLLEAKCYKLQQENISLKEPEMEVKRKKEKCVKVKDKYVEGKEKLGSEERKWREEELKIREECRQLGVEKRKLEIDLKAATSRREDGVDNVAEKLQEEKLMEMRWQLEREKKKLENNLRASAAEALRCVAMKLKASEAEVEALKILLEEKNCRIATLLTNNELLTRKILVLEGEKRKLEAEFGKVKEENRSKAERIFVIEKVREAEKRAMEAKGKKGVSELICRIEFLERKKLELEAKFCRVNREKSEAIMRSLNEKTTMEAESKKKGLELAWRIEVLEREKRENDAEDCQAGKEKNEEINRILNEKIIIEVQKTTMEVGCKMNECAVKSPKDVELPQRMHPASNVGTLSTPTAQHQGPKAIDVLSVARQKEGSDGSMQPRRMLGSDKQKRRVEGLGCSEANQAGTKRCKLDKLKECKLVWKNRKDMFEAFNDNDELCMRSVCALYRKYRCLGDWKYRLISTSFTGFRPPYEARGMALGELLTSGDPEGKLKKSLAEFARADPRGLEDCRLIAKHHYVQLLQIYMSNLDPLFISGDMN